MTTVGPSSSNQIQPFRFLDLSGELRNKIYELVLRLDRPVNLTNTNDIYQKHRNFHINSCSSDRHHELPNLTRSVADRDQVTWCEDPYTNTQQKLDFPRSVLSLRHVCKQIDEEMRFMFFAINEFHFRDASLAQRAFENMTNKGAVAAIKVLGFRFYGDRAPKVYPALAKACPNVRMLKVSMNADKHVAISGPQKTLRRARGVEAFASYIAGLEKLESFEIVGTDYVGWTVDGIEKSAQVDINHPLAIGSWFRAKIEMGKMERELLGKKDTRREKEEKERREKKMKAQRKRNELRRAETERRRLEAERLQRELLETRRQERLRRKQERLRSQRIERERQERLRGQRIERERKERERRRRQ
ncbi:hypothetical protein V493_04942 [Pseudogymnoascus sp. VKM F-4281 (FW-2241)]|nr:hypothetical protein V493_04942 [Pseudogymnoascus sp. VKM F-4281 (FW-2241)]